MIFDKIVQFFSRIVKIIDTSGGEICFTIALMKFK